MAELSPFTPKIALMVGAHADDTDVTASGTVAAWARAGAEVHYLVITDGSKGSADPHMSSEQLVKTREHEQQAAARHLGAKEVHFLPYEDAALEVTLALKKDIVRVIRKVRPDTVVVMDPTVVYTAGAHGYINHSDHRAAGQGTLDAVFPLARDRLTFPDLLAEEHLEPHSVAHVLLTSLSGERSNYFVDITDTFETKVQALLKHASQFTEPGRMRPLLEQWAAAAGAQAGVKYAEGFTRLDLA